LSEREQQGLPASQQAGFRTDGSLDLRGTKQASFWARPERSHNERGPTGTHCIMCSPTRSSVLEGPKGLTKNPSLISPPPSSPSGPARPDFRRNTQLVLPERRSPQSARRGGVETGPACLLSERPRSSSEKLPFSRGSGRGACRGRGRGRYYFCVIAALHVGSMVMVRDGSSLILLARCGGDRLLSEPRL